MNSPIQFGNEGGIRSLISRLAIPIKMNLMSNYQNGVEGELTQYVDDVEDLTETRFPNLTLGDTGGIGQFPSQSINAPIWDNKQTYDGTQVDFGAEGFSTLNYPDQQKSYDEVLEALKGLGQSKANAVSSNMFKDNVQWMTPEVFAAASPELLQKNLFGYK